MRTSQIPTGPFTRKKIARLTGLSDDVLAHWTKEGLLHPVEQVEGTGRHKEFDRLEVGKAAILQQMRAFGCGIDALRWFSRAIDMGRSIWTLVPNLPLKQTYKLSWLLKSYHQLQNGEQISIWDRSDDSLDRITARSLDDLVDHHFDDKDDDQFKAVAKEVALRFVDDEYARVGCDLIGDFSTSSIEDHRYKTIWLIWPRRDGNWSVFTDSDSNMSGLNDPPLGGILLHVSRILRELWALPAEGY